VHAEPKDARTDANSLTHELLKKSHVKTSIAYVALIMKSQIGGSNGKDTIYVAQK
jgi:hypothetical protein